MRVLSRSYQFNAVEEDSVLDVRAGQTAVGFALLGVSMFSATVAGGIAGGAPMVASLPAWTADGGVGSAAAVAVMLVVAALSGRAGWRAWQARVD